MKVSWAYVRDALSYLMLGASGSLMAVTIVTSPVSSDYASKVATQAHAVVSTPALAGGKTCEDGQVERDGRCVEVIPTPTPRPVSVAPARTQTPISAIETPTIVSTPDSTIEVSPPPESSSDSYDLETDSTIRAYYPSGQEAFEMSVDQEETRKGSHAEVTPDSGPIIEFARARLEIERKACEVTGGYIDSECKGRVQSAYDTYIATLEAAASGDD